MALSTPAAETARSDHTQYTLTIHRVHAHEPDRAAGTSGDDLRGTTRNCAEPSGTQFSPQLPTVRRHEGGIFHHGELQRSVGHAAGATDHRTDLSHVWVTQ